MVTKQPPGPRNFNASFGLTWRHWFAMRRDPVRFFTKLGHHYGDISFFRIFRYRCYLINHPDLIHTVLVDRADSFAKMSRERKIFSRVTGDGLLLSQGKVWQARRRMVRPAFNAGCLASACEAAVRSTSEAMKDWPDHGVVDFAEEMSRVMISATLRTQCGDVVRDIDVPQLARDNQLVSRHLIQETFALWPSNRRRKIIAAARARSRHILSSLMQKPMASGSHPPLLSRIRAARDAGELDPEQANDEAYTLLFAGSHTAATGLAWSGYEVSQHSRIQKAVRDELASLSVTRPPRYDDVVRMKFIPAVVRESLRLHPPAWGLFVREARKDVELGGYGIRKGSWVFIQPYVTHRDKRFFADPLKFDPSRFCGAGLSDPQTRAYFPFGMGPHLCVGRNMATIQMTAVVATILQRFELAATSNKVPTPEPQTSSWPRGGIRIRVRRW